MPHLLASYGRVAKEANVNLPSPEANYREQMVIVGLCFLGFFRTSGDGDGIPNLLGQSPVRALQVIIGAGLIATIVQMVRGTVPIWRNPVALSVLVIGGAGFLFHWNLNAVLLHAHHIVAFIFYYRATKSAQARRTFWIVSVATAVFGGTLISGAFDEPLRFSHWNSELNAFGILPNIDPGFLPPLKNGTARWYSIVLVMQSIHYFIWLGVLPILDAPREKMERSWTVRMQELKTNVGIELLAAFAVLALLVPVLGVLVHLPGTQAVYFALSSMHGLNEIRGLLPVFAVRDGPNV